MQATYNPLLKDLQKQKYAPMYLFYGEEPYYIDHLLELLEESVLDETEKSFNQTIAYGRDTDMGQLVNICRRFPMMGNRQLVILREAQDVDLKKEENLRPLLLYLDQPATFTILAIGFKYKNPPDKLLKAFSSSEKAVLFQSKRKWDSELPNWIAEFAKEKGYAVNTKACQMLTEFLGNDLEKIANELGKLFINHPKEKPVTEDVIEQYIGISKDFNIFELQNALAYRNVYKANLIAHHFAQNPKENSIFRTIPILYQFFSRLLVIHSMTDKSEVAVVSKFRLTGANKYAYFTGVRNYPPAKLLDIITWLREANTKALGIENLSADEGEILKELIFKILH